ncbi:MAG: dienelactone hydrolase family protein, partial [Gammaproteobacteria bacterium]|nr:dienelactone hydrolase family protein [Gammaproteobacteria bacterium]
MPRHPTAAALCRPPESSAAALHRPEAVVSSAGHRLPVCPSFRSPMTRERTLTLAANDGSRIAATLYLPSAGKGPGLLLCPNAAGDDDGFRSTAAVFAEEGYTVMVPDWPASAQPSATVLGCDEAGLEAVAALLAGLRRQPEASGRTGMLGFGSGGVFALRAAARCWVDCAVAYCP